MSYLPLNIDSCSTSEISDTCKSNEDNISSEETNIRSSRSSTFSVSSKSLSSELDDENSSIKPPAKPARKRRSSVSSSIQGEIYRARMSGADISIKEECEDSDDQITSEEYYEKIMIQAAKQENYDFLFEKGKCQPYEKIEVKAHPKKEATEAKNETTYSSIETEDVKSKLDKNIEEKLYAGPCRLERTRSQVMSDTAKKAYGTLKRAKKKIKKTIHRMSFRAPDHHQPSKVPGMSFDEFAELMKSGVDSEEIKQALLEMDAVSPKFKASLSKSDAEKGLKPKEVLDPCELVYDNIEATYSKVKKNKKYVSGADIKEKEEGATSGALASPYVNPKIVKIQVTNDTKDIEEEENIYDEAYNSMTDIECRTIGIVYDSEEFEEKAKLRLKELSVKEKFIPAFIKAMERRLEDQTIGLKETNIFYFILGAIQYTSDQENIKFEKTGGRFVDSSRGIQESEMDEMLREYDIETKEHSKHKISRGEYCISLCDKYWKKQPEYRLKESKFWAHVKFNFLTMLKQNETSIVSVNPIIPDSKFSKFYISKK